MPAYRAGFVCLSYGGGTDMTDKHNMYLSGPILPIFAKTGLPIVLIMLVNGVFTIVDAYFLGRYVGVDAVIAVTLMFPLYIMLVALSTLVSGGFSSVYARFLGAGQHDLARSVFVAAIQLSLVVCLVLIVLFTSFGRVISVQIANGSEDLAGLGRSYLSILIWCSPLAFILGINLDALRAEGVLAAMAGITLLSALLNIVFDWLFVAQMGWGVPGSAYGTVLSQICALVVLAIFRVSQHTAGMRQTQNWLAKPDVKQWRAMLALGAPSSLGYVGLSLSAGITLFCIQIWAGAQFEATSGAFGIMTRLKTFMFLPLLVVSLAFQTIVGNNFGAGQMDRTAATVRIAIVTALVYCVLMQIIFVLIAPYVGAWFVEDARIQAELARILPVTTLSMFAFGPLMMIATYFQAIGDAARAAILGLSRTYLFAIPLTFALPFVVGEWGIWLAGVIAEFLVFTLTAIVVMRYRRHLAAVAA
ncbi:MAG: putative MATE family efflux protein [Paracoccaceae bacterium]